MEFILWAIRVFVSPAFVGWLATAAWGWFMTPLPIGAQLAIPSALGALWVAVGSVTPRLLSSKPHADAVRTFTDGTGYTQGYGDGTTVLTVPFKNASTLRRWRLGEDCPVSATIEYFSGGNPIQIAHRGCWLGARLPYTKFIPGVTQSLILAVIDRKGISLPEAAPVSPADLESVKNDVLRAHHVGATFRLLGLDQGEYRVRVTLSAEGLNQMQEYSVGLLGEEDSWIEPL